MLRPAPLAPPAPLWPQPPILCYHKVDARFELLFTRLPPRTFRRQIEALARAGYRSLGSADLLAALAEASTPNLPRPRPHPLPAVVLSFDDAYAALARHAFPVLADHGFRALVFAITDYVGRENRWDVQYGWRRFRHLDWDELGYWQERGVEVHSHTATHARLTWLQESQVAEELGRSRELIASQLGRAPSGICYPYGAADGRVIALAEAAGYQLGFGGPAVPALRDAPAGPAVRVGPAGLPMLLERRPVYAWDRFSPPLVLGRSRLSGPGLALARFASRCAVGTAAIQRALGRRYTKKRAATGRSEG